MIAIIKANFNAHITDLLLAGCTDELDAKNEAYKVFECAGAIETVVFANRIIEIGPNGVIDKRMTYDEYISDERVKEQRSGLY